MIVDRPEGRNAVVKLFVFVPFLALVAAVPFAWGWGLSWIDVGLATSFYFFTCVGATVGFHRYFTHRVFKATRPVRVALAAVGSMAFQGPVIAWVADHRHHAFTDKEGDPHSPWLFGTSATAVAKGFWHSHFGWMLDHDVTKPARFAPDLLADPDIARRGTPPPRLATSGCESTSSPGRPRPKTCTATSPRSSAAAAPPSRGRWTTATRWLLAARPGRAPVAVVGRAEPDRRGREDRLPRAGHPDHP